MAYFLHAAHSLLAEVTPVTFAFHKRFADSKRHDAVIRGKTVSRKKLKVFTTVIMPLETGTDDVPNDRSDHVYHFLLR